MYNTPMKTDNDVFTLSGYLDEIADHPDWGYKYYRRPDSLHRALKRIGAPRQGPNQYLRADFDKVSGLNSLL